MRRWTMESCPLLNPAICRYIQIQDVIGQTTKSPLVQRSVLTKFVRLLILWFPIDNWPWIDREDVAGCVYLCEAADHQCTVWFFHVQSQNAPALFQLLHIICACDSATGTHWPNSKIMVKIWYSLMVTMTVLGLLGDGAV